MPWHCGYPAGRPGETRVATIDTQRRIDDDLSPWYQHLADDLRSRPALFVGTQLDEPPLWQQFAIRFAGRAERSGQRADPERPRSFMVSMVMPRARREVLRRLNVEWIPVHQATFATEVLA